MERVDAGLAPASLLYLAPDPAAPMRLRSLPQIYRNAARWREILTILSKYGLADWISRFDFPLGKSLLKARQGQVLTGERRETRIRLALEELGPTFIKLGQIMSTRPDLLGPELATELEQLQTCVPADPPQVVRDIVLRELGGPIEEVFDNFEEIPVASASIGQVHRARLKSGAKVAVKVQRQHIARRVRVDMEIMMGLAQLAERIPELHSYRPIASTEEFQRALRRELDFDRERRNMEEFRRCFAGSDVVCIPTPVTEHCTERVLTMQWLDGLPLSSPQAFAASPEELAAAAANGAEIYLEMVFQHGFYHADPHPGNLLLMEGGTIGLLDYGMVGRLDDSLREAIEDLLMAVVEQDSRQLCAVVMRVGSMPPVLDEGSLGVDLTEFVAHFANQPMQQFQLATALAEMIDIIRRHRILLPAPMTMLLKVLIMLEGTGRRLSPQFSLVEVLTPFRRKMLARRMSPSRQLRKARRIAFELEHLAEVMPRRLRDILQQVQSGKFDVHLDHRGLEPSVNRLVFGLITSALFLGSVQLVTNNVWPLWFWPLDGVSAPGLLGLGLSVALGMRLLRAISKSGHLDQRR